MKNRKISAVVVIAVLISAFSFGLHLWIRYDRYLDRIHTVGQLLGDSNQDQTEEPKPTPTNKLEALESIGYYGDPETCLMTAEQARAYADLLQSRCTIDGAEEQPKFWLLLGDFAGDGSPYLYVNHVQYDKIEFSKWTSVNINATEIYGWKDNTAQIIYEQPDASPTLEKQHKLTGSIILADRQRPNETDWCGKYYNFADGDVHLQYHWEKYFNWDDELWYFTENDRTVTYTSDEYYALPADMRNDPISRDIVLAGDGAPTDITARSISVTEMCDVLNLYADFLDTETSSNTP